MIRVGTGFDAHRFKVGRPLILGGVTVPHTHGLDGHSDADVLTHAICDALLGAAALGDLGVHFPATDARWQGVDSLQLLDAVVKQLTTASWHIGNVDATVIAESPKLADHCAPMCTILAARCKVDLSCVSVKATTTEGMGFCGRGEGIAAQAVVTIIS